MARKKKEKRLPIRVQRIIETVEAGQVLTKHHFINRQGNAETVFVLEPAGKPVAEQSAREAIDSGLLRPQGDGLFDAGTSQTWIFKDQWHG